jgi:hypothetical protein
MQPDADAIVSADVAPPPASMPRGRWWPTITNGYYQLPIAQMHGARSPLWMRIGHLDEPGVHELLDLLSWMMDRLDTGTMSAWELSELFERLEACELARGLG